MQPLPGIMGMASQVRAAQQSPQTNMVQCALRSRVAFDSLTWHS